MVVLHGELCEALSRPKAGWRTDRQVLESNDHENCSPIENEVALEPEANLKVCYTGSYGQRIHHRRALCQRQLALWHQRCDITSDEDSPQCGGS